MDKTEPPAGTESRVRRPPARRRLIGSNAFVRLAVVLSILLACAMVASLYVHWRRVREPSAVIVVVADPSWSGAKVIVSRSGDESHRVQVTLDERNQYQTPIYEFPGRYDIKVMLHDRPAWERTLEIERFPGFRIDLPTFVEIIGDSTLNDGQVLISSKDASYAGTFNAENKYRLVAPLYGGDYSLEVTRDGKILDHAEFTVTPHAARQIDLRKRS